MARQNKIRRVIVHYPTPDNQEEYDRRAARAVAKVLCKIYPLEVVDQIIEGLKQKQRSDN